MRQRGAAWELRVFLGRDAVTGKLRYATRSVRTGKREAQRLLAEMVLEAELGLCTRTNSTVGQLLEEWFELASRDFSPKTVVETRGIMNRNLLPTLKNTPLSKLTPSDLDRFYRRLQASGGRNGGPLAPATIKRIHGILRRALTQGVRWGWLGVNPAIACTPPRVPQSMIMPPDSDRLGELLRLAADIDPEMATYVTLAAVTGARRSEVIALRWSDIDFVDRTLAIERAIVMGPDGLVEKGTKTHTSRRVSLDGVTLQVLQQHLDAMHARAAGLGTALVTDALVFSHAPDCAQSWLPDSVTRSFRRLCCRSGLEGVRLHDLRHFVATQLLSAGVDVRTVEGRLGHRNAATTLNVYSHFLRQADEAQPTSSATSSHRGDRLTNSEAPWDPRRLMTLETRMSHSVLRHARLTSTFDQSLAHDD